MFWAIIGGGSGNYGIIISITVNLYNAPTGAQNVINLNITETYGALIELVYFYGVGPYSAVYNPNVFTQVMQSWFNNTINSKRTFNPIIQFKASNQLVPNGIFYFVFVSYCNDTLINCQNELNKYNLPPNQNSLIGAPIITPLSIKDFIVLFGCKPPVVTFNTDLNSWVCQSPDDHAGLYEIPGYVLNKIPNNSTIQQLGSLIIQSAINVTGTR